jgi:hypothetical protein
VERRQLQTFNDLEALHNLPCLQRGQLPSDLYTTMVNLVPPGEEESFLFRYLYIARLPPRLRMFAEGLSNHPNELLPDMCDYLWGFWSSGDPAGVWYHRHACRFSSFDPTCRGGRARGSRLPSRAPFPSACCRGIHAVPGDGPDCECWDF